MMRCIAGVALGLVLAACVLEPPDSPLEGTAWSLVQIGGQPVIPQTGDRAAFLVLEPGPGRASGSGGCNRFFGTYQRQDAVLQIGPLAATKMACLEGPALETAFFDALGQVRGWVIKHQQLFLTDAGGLLLLRFEAAGS